MFIAAAEIYIVAVLLLAFLLLGGLRILIVAVNGVVNIFVYLLKNPGTLLTLAAGIALLLLIWQRM